MENSKYLPYLDLKAKKGKSNICYSDLLSTNEWLQKREQIKRRDENRCCLCNRYPSDEVFFDSVTNLKVGYSWNFDLPLDPLRIEEHERKKLEYNSLPSDTRYKLELFYDLIKENFKNINELYNLIKDPVASQIKLLNDLKAFQLYTQIDEGDLPKLEKSKFVVELHVHHHYYVKGRLPWEYPDLALITLCHECHWDLHQKHRIPIYKDELMNERIQLTTCSRCNGAGVFPEYNHVQNGVCFECNGAMYIELKDYIWCVK